ncbi:MAG: DUF427 domain-containing protein [Nitriliruptoraceae bacterium]
MTRVLLGDAIIAESDDTIVVEGNHYFPPDSIRDGALQESPTRTQCHWKGTATYQHAVVGGEVTRDAAWSYPTPLPKAQHIAGYVAFDPSKVRVEG